MEKWARLKCGSYLVHFTRPYLTGVLHRYGIFNTAVGYWLSLKQKSLDKVGEKRCSWSFLSGRPVWIGERRSLQGTRVLCEMGF